MSSWNSDSDQHLVGTLKVIMKSKVVKMMVMSRNIFRKAQKISQAVLNSEVPLTMHKIPDTVEYFSLKF